jgi:hypothetical protein
MKKAFAMATLNAPQSSCSLFLLKVLAGHKQQQKAAAEYSRVHEYTLFHRNATWEVAHSIDRAD